MSTEIPIQHERVVEQIAKVIRNLAQHHEGPFVVALDGRSGSGKSTLAGLLSARTNAVVIESDDFYSGGTDDQWVKRTAWEKVDNCIDWRRLRVEVIEPLLAGHNAIWHAFNFATGAGLADDTEIRAPASVIIIDGVYSGRPELADLVDLSVLVELKNDSDRRQRLLAREGEVFMCAWHALWDEAEDYYFTLVRPPDSYDLLIVFD